MRGPMANGRNGEAGLGGGEIPRSCLGSGGGAGGGGGGEEGGGDVIDEEILLRVEREVMDMKKKAMEYRERAPAAFVSLLERSLERWRDSLTSVTARSPNLTQSEGEQDSSAEVLALRAHLSERLAAAKASLPILIQNLNSCRHQIDKAIAAHTILEEP